MSHVGHDCPCAAEKREVERELVERSDNGVLPLVIVPYFDPTGSTNAPPSEGESAVVLGHIDTTQDAHAT